MNWYIQVTENIKFYFLNLYLNDSSLTYRRKPCDQLKIRSTRDGRGNLKRDKGRKSNDNTRMYHRTAGCDSYLWTISYGLHHIPSDIRLSKEQNKNNEEDRCVGENEEEKDEFNVDCTLFSSSEAYVGFFVNY
jgi:hypothetical protein